MSEAKQLPDNEQPTTKLPAEPAVFVEPLPLAESAVDSAAQSGHTSSRAIGARTGPWFAEKAASFFLKIILLAGGFFAVGAALTTLILMDLLDHKSGWLKELLQFIKETSKIFVK